MLFPEILNNFSYPDNGQVNVFMFLPVGFLVFLFFIVSFKNQQGFRKSFLTAAVLWGAAVVVLTEALNVLRLVNFAGFLCAWSVAVLGALAYYLRLKKGRLKIHVPAMGSFDLIIILNLSIFVGIIGLIAVLRPPNTIDAMTYHMSRVAHWMQNSSLAFFPTNNERQLYSNPFSEFVILQFQALGQGSDRFANFMQWLSFAGSILGTTLIAQELGAKAKGQIFTAIMTATIPMGILQASNTKNDLVLAFWLVCFLYFLLLALKSNHYSPVILGTSLGLCFLTKGTAYLFALPFIIWLGIRLLTRRPAAKMLKVFGVIVGIVLLLNAGHYLRCFKLYDRPVARGNQETEQLTNKMISAKTVLANILRSMGEHMAVPNEKANTVLNGSIESVFDMMNLDIHDPRISLSGYPGVSWPWHEERAGSPFQFYLFVICLAAFLLKRRKGFDAFVGKYLMAVLLAGILFSLLIKFSMWQTRHQLPLVVVLSPFIGVVLASMLPDNIIRGASLLILNCSWGFVLLNPSAPVLKEENIFNTKRVYQYYFNSHGLLYSHIKLINEIQDAGCQEVGLLLGWDSWEYPYWVLMQSDQAKDLRLQHIRVFNKSKDTPADKLNGHFRPCAIIQDLQKPDGPTQKLVMPADGSLFLEKRRTPYVSLFLRKDLLR